MSATTTTYSRPAEAKTQNREGWLMSAADQLWSRVIEAGGERPKVCRVSCGWPSRSALQTASSRSRRIGEAWHSSASEDGAREVFISPALVDEVEVMGVLLHELIHAALPADAGHGPAFQRIMKRVGLVGKPTATEVGEELEVELQIVAHELGRYPHAKLDAPVKAGKPGRMVKGSCPNCGNPVHGSRQALDVPPVCGVCGEVYVVEFTDAQAVAWNVAPTLHTEALETVSTTVELKTKDGRFTLSSTKTGGREGAWTVTDFQAVEVSRRTVEVGGEAAEVVEYEDRWTYRTNRADALAFVAAIRSGEVAWDDVTEADDFEEEWVDEDELGELGEWDDDEGDFLDDDELETPDYPEDMPVSEAPASGLKPWERFTREAATEEEFAEMERLRDESGSRKSETIARGDEGAMD